MYMAWHYFMDFSHVNYYAYPAVQLVMRCADVFIMAGPASLLSSVLCTRSSRNHTDDLVWKN